MTTAPNVRIPMIDPYTGLITPIYQKFFAEMAAAVPIRKPLTGSAVYDAPSLAAGGTVTTTVPVQGAQLGQIANASFSLDTQGVLVSAAVSALNVVSVTLLNPTTAAGAVDLGSGSISVTVT